MNQPWGELVHIVVTRFKAGEHPWTREEFYNASDDQHYATHTVDPIVIEMNGDIRVADSSNWWEEGYLWSGNILELDDNYKLMEDIYRLVITPIGKPSKEKDNHCTLLEYEAMGAGIRDVFEDHIPQIVELFNNLFPDREHIELVTLWECDAGKDQDTWEGPGEYYSWWELVGAVIPHKDRVELRKLDDNINQSEASVHSPGAE